MAPAEGLSAPGPRARGPLSQLPTPSRGAPGQGPAGQRPGSREPCGRTGTEPPEPPRSPLPGVREGVRSRPQPRPRRCQKRCPPIPIPTTGQDFCECFQPRSRSPSAPPRPRPPSFQEVRLRVQEGPSSLPFQLHKTSRSRQRSHGAPLSRLLPQRPPRFSRGGRGTPRRGDSPFSWDRKP